MFKNEKGFRKMKAILVLIVLLAMSPRIGWSENDYSLVYSAIDVSGGPVASAVNPAEDLVSLDIQGKSCATSASYTIASILRWPEAGNSVSNWTLYN